MTTRLIIADDDPLVRTGLRSLLRHDSLEIVAEASDGAAVLRLLEVVRADVVLMDVQMPRLSGVAAIAPVRARLPDARIILMTTFDADRFAVHAKAAGADAFVRKSAPATEILAAIYGRTVREARGHPGAARLSPRERDVGIRIAGGCSNEEIAVELGVSINTIKTYVSRLFAKFGVSNRVQLANAFNGLRGGYDAAGSTADRG
ncbi:response regulator [Pseudolysinimonas sp.]|jgi:DNA-binding NarL/FixJ family response regulator|uniref:response regulator transcription factor n=1 Tax=Pseudolysinimonas sp. TaxID=2680009 RepID=UPI003784547E